MACEPLPPELRDCAGLLFGLLELELDARPRLCVLVPPLLLREPLLELRPLLAERLAVAVLRPFEDERLLELEDDLREDAEAREPFELERFAELRDPALREVVDFDAAIVTSLFS